MTDYLPKAATIEQACAWLEQQTGSAWTLARLLECGQKPWFWLDYSTDAPKELFGDKIEGYLAPMIFAGDTHRLEMYGEFALVTMTRTHDDNLIRMMPGMRLDLSEIRFKRESIERVAKIINEQKESQLAASSGAPESDEPPAHKATPAEHDMTSERGCRELILRNWDMIKALHGDKPSARQVLRIVERNIGKFEEAPTLKTVSNKMSELRKEKLIP